MTIAPGAGLLAEPMERWTDERLVQSCLAGEQAAWAALIRRYERLIYSIPFRYGAKPEDAADIFQNVCLELYGELPRLRKVESLRSWLITVAMRRSLKWKQSRQRYEMDDEGVLAEVADPEAVASPEWLAQAERAQVVREALATLTERCQSLLRQLFFEDPPRPYEEVSRSLGLAIGSMGFMRSRCLEKMRRAMEGLGL
jgi:RNA polymerase sigma factor (sigma-70 family)